jgi:hypothetical protein
MRFMWRFLDFSPSDLIRPLAPVFGVAMASALINILARIVWPEEVVYLMSVAVITASLNFLICGRYLLGAEERRFLADRFRSIRLRTASPVDRG